MSRYVACIVQRDGVARYLVRGRLTDWQRQATHYAHPSAAREAINAFMTRVFKAGRFQRDYADQIIDTVDPERQVNA